MEQNCKNTPLPDIEIFVEKELHNIKSIEAVHRINVYNYETPEIINFFENNKSNKKFVGIMNVFITNETFNHTELTYKFVEVTDDDEKNQLVISTTKEAFSNRMSFLPANEQLRSLSERANNIKNGRVYKYTSTLNHQVVGLIFLRNYIYNNENINLLAWVWKDKNISKIDSTIFNEQIKRVYSKSKLPVFAFVHKENCKSFYFHMNNFFKPKWLVFQK